MRFNRRSRTETALCASVAVAIALGGLVMIVHGFLPGSDAAMIAKRQQLEATFEQLAVARALAQGEVRQAAVDVSTQTR